MDRLPREILDTIALILNPFQAKSLANSVGFVDNNAANRLWRCMFKNEAWFNEARGLSAEPVLIGNSLNDIISDRPGRKKLACIILYSNDFTGDLFHGGVYFLRKSLPKDHRYDEKRHEVVLL